MSKASAVAMYLAEFIGTFMLVFTVGLNVLTGSKTWAVTSIACVLTAGIYATADVSGGHLNPAVTVALELAGKGKGIAELCKYVCAQIAGGIAAGFCYSSLLDEDIHLKPQKSYNVWQAGIAETLYTFMLTFTVLNVAASNAHAGKNQFYGLAIGFTVIAGGYGAGQISGGCFNPAVAIGIDASGFSHGFGYCLVYALFELAGSALAAGLFRVCRPGDYGNAENPLRAKLCSEFLGAFMLVLTVGLNVVHGSKAGAFSIAASLMCMIFALGSVSGAHFNPAVTTAVFCRGGNKITAKDAVLYICAQLLGGICAGLVYFMLTGQAHGIPSAISHGNTAAYIGEAVYTFFLAFVVISVATVDNPLSEFFGLAIGFCIIVGGFAVGSISGGLLNPAVSTGLTFSYLLSGGSCFGRWIAYVIVQLIGGVIAGLIFRILRPQSGESLLS